ncbi:MAG: phage portal protein [Cyanobacteria bacterium P01_A01_bin.17]
MAIWKRLASLVTGAAYRQEGLQNGEPAYYSGEAATPVTVDSAMQLSAVWACARLISETVGSLPIKLYRKKPDGSRVLLKDHKLARLLDGGKVNKWQTRQEFFETLTYQLCLKGNAYAEKKYGPNGDLIALHPFMSQQMEVLLEENGNVRYRYTENTSQEYSQEQVWHCKLFGTGVIGLSVLDYMRNSIGIAQGAENTTTKVYKNGGKPSGVLSYDKVLTVEQREAVKNNFSELASGNNDRLFVLEAGMDYQQVSLSPQDIELLSSRRFQIEDIARFFGVPSVLINDTSSNTTWGSGLSEIVQGFYKFNMRPYLERYQSSMECWLLSPAERRTIDIEFDTSALLRPDQNERMENYKTAIQGGALTPNEARLLEGMEPKEGGDSLYLQQQMVPIEKLQNGPINEKPDTTSD